MEGLLLSTAYDNSSPRLSCCIIRCLHVDPLPNRDALLTNCNVNIKSFLFPIEPSDSCLFNAKEHIFNGYTFSLKHNIQRH